MIKSKVILCAAIALSALSLPAIADDQTVYAQISQPGGPESRSESPPMDTPFNLPIKYIGNAESHKFHRPSCPFAGIMALNKRVQFHYRTQAVACGHVPCRYCLPPVWTVVRGRLLTPANTAEPKPELPSGSIGHPHSSRDCQWNPRPDIVPAPQPDPLAKPRRDPAVDVPADSP